MLLFYECALVLIVYRWPLLLHLPRHHTALSLFSHLLPAFHRRVHVVGLPPSHQSPWFQCTVRDGGLLHFWSHGLPVPVPESAGPGPVSPPHSVGQVRRLYETTERLIPNDYTDVSAQDRTSLPGEKTGNIFHLVKRFLKLMHNCIDFA